MESIILQFGIKTNFLELFNEPYNYYFFLKQMLCNIIFKIIIHFIIYIKGSMNIL
jgi:hypothetical protein